MSNVLTIKLETFGTTKLVLRAHWRQVEIATCKLTWFSLQETVHVWLVVPVLHSKHAVTSFQKFNGSFQELQQLFTAGFRDIMWLLVPVLQGKSTIDVLPYRLHECHSKVSALVRCLLALKKSVDLSSKTHGARSRYSSRNSSVGQCRVDDSVPN